MDVYIAEMFELHRNVFENLLGCLMADFLDPSSVTSVVTAEDVSD